MRGKKRHQPYDEKWTHKPYTKLSVYKKGKIKAIDARLPNVYNFYFEKD